MRERSEHDAMCQRLQRAFADARGPIGLSKPTSNLFRKRDPSGKHRVDVRGFDSVLSVDRDRVTADVQGMASFETLVDETLKFGLLPSVVPQLKTITLGGAVSGLGIESSSFRYGLVHEAVESMDILLGDGRILTCSCNENPDLFFGFPNSYGTLGYALLLRVRLIPAQSFVHLEHQCFNDLHAYLKNLEEACHAADADYIDGAIFSSSEMYLTRAKFCATAPRLSDYKYMKIYYQSIREKTEDWLTAKDYIWRWDTDWFWCSKHFGVQHPALRWLAKPWLNSKSYQRVMRVAQRVMPDRGKAESVIQDVDIPIYNAPEFLEFLLREIPVTPVWMCPFKTSSRKWDLSPLERETLHVNFGFWDVVPSTHKPGYFNRQIEDKARLLKGTKGLYSSSFYTEDTFWKIYDRPRYRQLKAQYDPKHAFRDLYQKCVLNR